MTTHEFTVTIPVHIVVDALSLALIAGGVAMMWLGLKLFRQGLHRLKEIRAYKAVAAAELEAAATALACGDSAYISADAYNAASPFRNLKAIAKVLDHKKLVITSSRPFTASAPTIPGWKKS